MEIINYFTEMSPRTKAFIGILFIALTSAMVSFVRSKLFQELLTGMFNYIGTKRSGKVDDKSDSSSSSTTTTQQSSTNIVSTQVRLSVSYAIEESDIINHDFFNYVDFWIYNQVPSMILRTQYRTAVFRKYLHIYFKTYRNTLQDFVRSGSYKTMSSTELRRTLLHLITDTIRNMEIEMREIGIPDVIITKMKNVLSDRINLTMDLINSICDSSFYDSSENYLKIYSFLNIIHSILDNTISNISSVCDDINGEMAGLSIDGFVEPKGHPKI